MKKKKVFSILSSTAIFLSLYSAPSVSAISQNINELEQEKQELNQQKDNISGNINDTEQEMQSLDSERQQLSEDIVGIQTNIDNVIGQIAKQEEEIARLEEEINQLNEEIEILKDKIEKRKGALAEQARGVQTTGSPSNIIDLILSAESLTDLVGAMEVINLLVNNNNSVMEDQLADQQAVEEKAEGVRVAKEDTDQVKQEMEVSRNNLVAQRMELDNKIQIVAENFDLTNSERDSLLSQRDAIASQTSDIDGQIQEEQTRIAAEEEARKEREARRIAEAEQKAKEAEEKSVQTASSSQAAAPAQAPDPEPTPDPKPDQAPTNSGGWARPASGYVTSEFGYRIHPIDGTNKLHAGIDIGGSGPITAAKSGTVVSASYNSISGYNVTIDHGDGIRTRYYHMTPNLRVAPGQSVSQGQQIGTMGTTGSSTGVHLHFQVHVNGTPVNPRGYVNF